MDMRSRLPGLASLQAKTLGDPRVCVAVLDGPVDLTHPCFLGADLRSLATLAGSEVGAGMMSLHGTHVTSLIFGQPGSPILGIAPRCSGLIVPIFRDGSAEKASQLDVARAIDQALDGGADVISISGGERSPTGEAQSVLEHVLRRCADAGVLVVAAVGNDGCDCVQVPAAVASVLAVGACDSDGEPLLSNNWGKAFNLNGVLAPGHEIDGAAPGGERQTLTGSSFATPLVAGIAALLLSTGLDSDRPARAVDAGAAILASAIPCPIPDDVDGCRRHLVGRLNVSGAHEFITKRGDATVDDHSEAATKPPSLDPSPRPPVREPLTGYDRHPAGAGAAFEAATAVPTTTLSVESPVAIPEQAATAGSLAATPPRQALATPATLSPLSAGFRAASSACGCGGEPAGLVYAIGTLNYDFGTEAGRDGFRQQMSGLTFPDNLAPNPYNPNHVSYYLRLNPWAADKLIWTLELDRTPIYALVAETPVGMTWDGFEPIPDNDEYPEDSPEDELAEQIADRNVLAKILRNFVAKSQPESYVYHTFRNAIVGQIQPNGHPQLVSRVSIPGVLTNRKVRLLTGQEVPVVEVTARSLYTWNEQALVDAAIDSVTQSAAFQAEVQPLSRSDRDQRLVDLEKTVRAFLDKIYYQFRNLGQSSPDRALNFAGTNAFAITDDLVTGLTSGRYVPGSTQPFYALDTITVAKSPYCRMDSDCWDIVVTFFDPADDRRSRVSYLYTIDVARALPVSLGPSHQFLGN